MEGEDTFLEGIDGMLTDLKSMYMKALFEELKTALVLLKEMNH